MSKRKLKDVTNEDTTVVERVFIVWTDPWDFEEFDAVATRFEQRGWRVLNEQDEMPLYEGDVRATLRELCDATVVALPTTWWTSVTGHQVVQVAGWLGIKFLDHQGDVIPTRSLKGA